jgi:hypothetical protein
MSLNLILLSLFQSSIVNQTINQVLFIDLYALVDNIKHKFSPMLLTKKYFGESTTNQFSRLILASQINKQPMVNLKSN